MAVSWFNNIPAISVLKTGLAASVSFKFERMPITDIFEKSPLQSVNETDSQNAEIQAIFDKTYEEVLDENPIVKELNIKKPCLFFDNDTSSQIAAAYSLWDNSITSHLTLSDKYLFYTENNGEKVPFMISESIDKFENDPDIKYVKLNEQENELYISAIFAHELRHCIQEHLIFSTKGCENAAETLKKGYAGVKKSAGGLLILIDELRMQRTLTDEEEKIAKEAKRNLNRTEYAVNYKPKKLLDENTKLKYKFAKNNNSYFSVKEHFAPAKLKGTCSYQTNPLEIDAYGYETEFLAKHGQDKEGIRKDVLELLEIFSLLSTDYSRMELPFVE